MGPPRDPCKTEDGILKHLPLIVGMGLLGAPKSLPRTGDGTPKISPLLGMGPPQTPPPQIWVGTLKSLPEIGGGTPRDPPKLGLVPRMSLSLGATRGPQAVRVTVPGAMGLSPSSLHRVPTDE